ncbi:hypothetical protein, partial [Rhizobium favelukesii]|uniref:hypothetical protein n=1 Tax=Rhizobium favelukesii TaxID=348824 RepID=UPI002160C32F
RRIDSPRAAQMPPKSPPILYKVELRTRLNLIGCFSSDSLPVGGATLQTVTLFASESSTIMLLVACEKPFCGGGNWPIATI